MPLYYQGEVRIFKLPTRPYGTNGYILAPSQGDEGVIIDTPAQPEDLLRDAQGLRIRFILITHSHFDHLMGLETLRSKTGAPVGIHPLDAHALPQAPDILLEDGARLTVGGLEVQVLHTPGHTPGAVCFRVGKHLFSGDTLFPGGPGKTRGPEAFRQIVHSITTKLYALPEDTVVYPGHGPATTIGQSKEEYRVFSQRPHPADLCGDVLWLES